MAENIEHASDLYGPKSKRDEIMVRLEPSALSRDELLIFEQWLSDHLSKLYQDVLKEPLPNDLNEILEGFKSTRRGQNGNGQSAPAASKSMIPRR
jgi:hypothetical protein